MDYHIGTGQTYATLQAAIPDIITNVDLAPVFILHGDSSSPIPGGCVIDWTVLDPMVFTGIAITIVNYTGDTPVIDGSINSDTAGIVINLNIGATGASINCSNIEIKNINGSALILNAIDSVSCNSMKVDDNVGDMSIVNSNQLNDNTCIGNQFYNSQGGFTFSSAAAGSCSGNKIYNCAFASITFAAGIGRGPSIDGNLILNTGGINMSSGGGTFPQDICGGTNITYFNPGADFSFPVGGSNTFFAVVNNTFSTIITAFNLTADKVKYNVADLATFTGSITSQLAVTGARVLVEVRKVSTPTIVEATILDTTTNLVANTAKTLDAIKGSALTWSVAEGVDYFVRLQVSGGFPAVSNPGVVENIATSPFAGVNIGLKYIIKL